jgi:pimeloyl-ACP methyl ester carboxylesterase
MNKDKDKEIEMTTTDLIDNKYINNNNAVKRNEEETISINEIRKLHQNHKIIDPLPQFHTQVIPLEKELFQNINLEWGVDIISENIPLIDENNNNYYIHMLRTANPDPNKNNFLLIHGFLSSSLHFICILPYLIKRYNIFIPDTIGMGLSSRPQITFNSPIQCETFFLNAYHIFINELFFKGRFNIKKEYYLCGHSLGGFIASRYMLKYPKGIKKVLLLSPAGITDYNIPGTNFYENTNCCWYCAIVCCTTFVWPCKLRLQTAYNCICCHNKIKQAYGNKRVHFDENEIKRNPDGSIFKLNYPRISQILKELTILSLDYPKDLYKCAYYLFGVPPPAAFIPIEKKIIQYNKIDIIFVFGEKDWMDRIGAYRLAKLDSKKYKVFTVSNAGHSFARQNPEELSLIIANFFEE